MEELSAIPVWLCIPFAGLLLSIAVMPLIKPDWWESISRLQLRSGRYCLLFRLLQSTECLQWERRFWNVW